LLLTRFMATFNKWADKLINGSIYWRSQSVPKDTAVLV
jgi:hypothetical protein